MLRDPQGIAVDASGRVYCGVAARRIHVYDPTGRIVRAWPLETDGAPLRLRLTPGGDGPVVEVAVQGAEAVLRYDAEGHPLAVRTDPDAFEAFGAAGEREVTAPDGVRHAFEGTALVRGAPGAIEVIVEPIPVPLRWVAGASWILVATFIVGAIAIFAGIVRSGRPGPHAERA